MAFDALEELRAAGNQLDLLTDAQRAILAELSEEEVAMFNSIRARVDAASAEVVGQTADSNGGFIY
jgi:hypothetical protein